jgi:hypothetical protein
LLHEAQDSENVDAASLHFTLITVVNCNHDNEAGLAVNKEAEEGAEEGPEEGTAEEAEERAKEGAHLKAREEQTQELEAVAVIGEDERPNSPGMSCIKFLVFCVADIPLEVE